MTRKTIALLAVLQLCLTSGCQFIYPTQTVNVEVRDAETDQPIEYVRVSVAQDKLRGQFSDSEATDQFGQVQLEVLKNRPVQFTTKSDEYLQPGEFSFAEADTAITKKLIHLYKNPKPSLKFILPNDYRGKVRFEILPGGKKNHPGGCREFIYHVKNDEPIQVHSDFLLEYFEHENINFEFQNGTKVISSGYSVSAESREFRDSKDKTLLKSIFSFHGRDSKKTSRIIRAKFNGPFRTP